MNDLRKAAEMALETLCVGANDAVPNDIDERFEQAIQALRQALAQPEQEPIAWMCEDPHHIGQCVTIYKTPPSIEAAVLAEREACAKVCLEEAPSLDGQLCAEAIRARGEK